MHEGEQGRVKRIRCWWRKGSLKGLASPKEVFQLVEASRLAFSCEKSLLGLKGRFSFNGDFIDCNLLISPPEALKPHPVWGQTVRESRTWWDRAKDLALHGKESAKVAVLARPCLSASHLALSASSPSLVIHCRSFRTRLPKRHVVKSSVP